MATSGAYRSLANKEKQKLAPIFASLLHKKQAVSPRSDHQPWNVVISMPIRYSGGDSDPSLSPGDLWHSSVEQSKEGLIRFSKVAFSMGVFPRTDS